jgi:hypothetical protein
MSNKARQRPRQSGSWSFVNCLRKFLTPALYKQAHHAAAAGKQQRSDTRWTVQPLLLTLLTLTWCSGDSLGERFETARAFTVVLLPKRRRPGHTVQGFQKALARLPVSVLRVVAAVLRRRLLCLFAPFLEVDGLHPFGCDGSRLRCPRSAELEQRLGQGAQAEAPPQVWLTALVHLRLGLLWAWQLGKGDASERQHCQRLLDTLPDKAVLVADAGYQGYDLVASLLAAKVHFLIRVSSQTTLYSLTGVPAASWTDGLVYWWTQEAQKKEQAPLELRLLRVRSRQRKVDVWLVTDVHCPVQLPLTTAAKFYRMRWENEGFFRTYKRTLGKVKLSSHSVRLVHREAYGSLLAVQLLLAQGAWAVAVLAQQPSAQSSPRGVLREMRQEIQGRLGPRQRRHYGQRLARAQREQRPQRRSSKVKRPWPGRQPHKPPKAPKILKISEQLKAFLEKELHAA